MFVLTLVWRHRTWNWNPVSAVNVAGKAADLTDDPLPGQPNHQGGAVVALQRRAERSNQELVRFWLGANLETLNVWELLLLLLLLLLWRGVRWWRHHPVLIWTTYGQCVVLQKQNKPFFKRLWQFAEIMCWKLSISHKLVDNQQVYKTDPSFSKELNNQQQWNVLAVTVNLILCAQS